MDNDTVLGKLKVESDVTVQFVNDIMCTAFDGGVGGAWYWIEDYYCYLGDKSGRLGSELGIEYFHDLLPLGGKIRIKADGDEEIRTLDLDSFLEGLRLYCQHKSYLQLVEDHDADDADEIIQYALFGKSVYG